MYFNMIKLSEISNLFSSVKRIVAHQKQIERLKGEQFNIFSVLRMERSENRTHSAFLSELLNPIGTHQKGSIFLKLFLESIKLDNYLSIETSVVSTEYHIGQRNDIEKKGGRIDILIRDGNDKTITIENKIDGIDQHIQIERYYNFNKEINKVFYLTLDGKEPAPESKGNLLAGQDFKLLSYRNDIKDWLELCLKEAADAPMLRESIKQYIILIKKMTSSPDKQHEKELIELVINNYEAALFVNNTILKARHRIADSVRVAVREKLKVNMPAGLTAGIGVDIDKRYAQIWVWHDLFPQAQLYFGIESFNGTGNYNGDLFIGVFNSNLTANSYTNEFAANPPIHWYEVVFLEFEGAHVNFGNDAMILKIQNLVGFKDKLIEQITSQILGYILSSEQKLLDHLKAMNQSLEELK
jgi:PD-(D/E)XK nuclease superfamily protein